MSTWLLVVCLLIAAVAMGLYLYAVSLNPGDIVELSPETTERPLDL